MRAVQELDRRLIAAAAAGVIGLGAVGLWMGRGEPSVAVPAQARTTPELKTKPPSQNITPIPERPAFIPSVLPFTLAPETPRPTDRLFDTSVEGVKEGISFTQALFNLPTEQVLDRFSTSAKRAWAQNPEAKQQMVNRINNIRKYVLSCRADIYNVLRVSYNPNFELATLVILNKHCDFGGSSKSNFLVAFQKEGDEWKPYGLNY